jgi:alpha-D-xyloside xylohydrolase
MFGSSLLVCPVYEYKARSRAVYFPVGAGWYDVYTGEYLSGGQRLEVSAPYDRIPLYASAGSIIPVGDVIQSTVEAQRDLTLFVYRGKDGESESTKS